MSLMLACVLSSAFGFTAALAYGAFAWRRPLEDAKAALHVEYDRVLGLKAALLDAKRSARLLRPPVQAEIMQWARPRCSKCRGQGFNDKGFCDCIVRSALYKKAVEEGRVVEIRKPYQRRPVPWVAELTELPES